MKKLKYESIMVSSRNPKDTNISLGCTMFEDGQLYYVEGKNVVRLKEYFADTKMTAAELFEKAIKYEAKNETEISQ